MLQDTCSTYIFVKYILYAMLEIIPLFVLFIILEKNVECIYYSAIKIKNYFPPVLKGNIFVIIPYALDMKNMTHTQTKLGFSRIVSIAKTLTRKMLSFSVQLYTVCL